jgi:histidine ammonia-lyase/phenylalanine ammonia-lyase
MDKTSSSEVVHMAVRRAVDPQDASTGSIPIDGQRLSLDQIGAVARGDARVVLSSDPGVRRALDASRGVALEHIARGEPIYGVTTGFGDSAHRQIGSEQTRMLQSRLVECLGQGTGRTTPVDTARAVVLLRANSLARGHSAVRPELVERLLELLNRGITPLIPEEGSVGASGDLVPLSYVAAVVTGARAVDHRGRERATADALGDEGLDALELEAKEGLALVNGTAFMTAFAALAAIDARRIAIVSDVCTAMTVEVLCGITGPFDAFLHDVAKPHAGQIASAATIRALLAGSRLAQSYEDVVGELGNGNGAYRELVQKVQDRYSVRCAPHFTGVLRDTLDWVERWLDVEINSTNDNPLFDAASGRVHSGGNFAGGHVALAMDSLKTAVASVGDLMDRQLELVVDEKFNNGLTPNLIPRVAADDPEAGLNHGFKAMQLACSSLTAEALSACMPLTVFSRSTECHNQDKVSMGATAARRARDVVALVEKVAAIHLIALCQAADLRGADRLGATRRTYDIVRSHVAPLDVDRSMADDIARVVELIRDGTLTDGLS